MPETEQNKFAPAILKVLRALDPAIPAVMQQDTEVARRAHLTARFGVMGCLFGAIFAAFYIGIDHRWGAIIVISCSISFAITPIIIRLSQRPETAGHVLVLTMATGFFALCCVEGGLLGHAIAWLVSIPLCAFLLVGTGAARAWAMIVFFAAAAVAAVDLSGHHMPTTFDPKWNVIVSTAGYLGLIVFMYVLGLIFEASRARAFGKLQDALKDLATSNEHLKHMNVEKNEFLGIVAHDLKSPLSIILGSAELITISDEPGEVEKMTETIINASTRMKDLITDLLDANAIEQGKFASRIEPYDLNALVAKIVEHNQPAAVRKNITLKIGITPNLWAKADVAATTQILENLISNALKFSPPQTSVNIHTMPEAHHVVVAVRDQGPGVSEEDQKKMFGKYTRLSARPTGGESSTGLGLSIVKKLAEAMHGTVQCRSVLGDGATFSLRLPICPKNEIPHVTPLPTKVNPNYIQFPTEESRKNTGGAS